MNKLDPKTPDVDEIDSTTPTPGGGSDPHTERPAGPDHNRGNIADVNIHDMYLDSLHPDWESIVNQPLHVAWEHWPEHPAHEEGETERKLRKYRANRRRAHQHQHAKSTFKNMVSIPRCIAVTSSPFVFLR